MNNKAISAIRFYLLVLLVGVVAGLGAIIFRDLIGLFHNLFFDGQLSFDYDVFLHAEASRWGVGIILVPVIGAMIVAFLVKNFAPEAKGHGVPEVMDAIYYERGIVRPIVAVVKAIASSITIGSGGSVGREGPIIQIGAAFGSAVGQWIKVPDWERITLIACGAGGGIAATFNTPFGGILFAIEIMLPELSARTLMPVSIATAVAVYISYFKFGNVAFIPFTAQTVSHQDVFTVSCYLFLSLLFGIFSVLFIRCVYFAEDMFDAISSNYYIRHMLGMLIVGITLYLMFHYFGHYYIQGVGYATIDDVLKELIKNPGLLLFLAVMKILDTGLTLGSGGSGGVFSPLLFIGATLGACLFGLIDMMFPGQSAVNIQLGAMAGMAAIVGASTGAVMTAIVMTAEMTGDFNIILPLMIIVSVANLVRRLFCPDTIYTLKLSRRGHFVPESLHRTKPHISL